MEVVVQILEQGIHYFSDMLMDLLEFKSGSKNFHDIVVDYTLTLARSLTYSRNLSKELHKFQLSQFIN